MINKIFDKHYRDFLPLIDTDSVDAIIIDPPYGINYHQMTWDEPGALDWKFILHECSRIVKPTGNFITFTGWSNLEKMYLNYDRYFQEVAINLSGNMKDLLTLRNSIIWDRIKTKNGGKKNFTSAREDILWYTISDDYTFNKEDSLILKKTKGFGSKNGSDYRRLSNVFTDIPPIIYSSKEYNGYPCQKPLALMRRLIRIFSNPDDLVLDCFCGGGSTLEACAIEGRQFIGNDNNKEAIEISKKRLEKYEEIRRFI